MLRHPSHNDPIAATICGCRVPTNDASPIPTGPATHFRFCAYDVSAALRRVQLGSTTSNDRTNPCSDAALNVERSIDYSIDGAGRRVGRVGPANGPVCVGAREDAAEIGCWTAREPVGFEGADTQWWTDIGTETNGGCDNLREQVRVEGFLWVVAED